MAIAEVHSKRLLTGFWARKWRKYATIAAAGCDLVTYRLIYVNLTLTWNYEHSRRWLSVEGRESLFILMMTQTVVRWGSTSAIAKAVSWPRTPRSHDTHPTPGHCRHGSVSLIILTARGGGKSASGGGARSHQHRSQLQLLRASCDMMLAQTNEWRTSDKQSALRLIVSKQERFLPRRIRLSSSTASTTVISAGRLQRRSCFGSRRADTPAFLKETWHPKQPSDLSLWSKALHLQDWNF